jgi:hypothetical protein
MSLAQRESRFNDLCSRFPNRSMGRLLAVYTLPEKEFEALKVATMLFLSRCLPNKGTLVEEDKLMEAFESNIHAVSNMTPNGKMMPKPFLTLEYNMWVRSIVDIIETMNVADLVDTFRLPTLRYKASQQSDELLRRPYATEKPHLETWVGHTQDSIAFHIPILGDIANNYLQLCSPPEDFEESWADPLEDFTAGEEIAGKYQMQDVRPEPGYLYVFECTSLHYSVRNPGAGSRVSLEVTCLMHDKIRRESKEAQSARSKLDSDFSFVDLRALGDRKVLRLFDTMSGVMEAKDVVDM